jgi:hypothetical protein
MPKTNIIGLSQYNTSLSKFYIIDLRDNTVFDIPFPPTEMAERPNTPQFTGENVVGRTSQIVNYVYSDNRTVTISFTVIDDYIKMPLTEVRDLLSSMAMPSYEGYQIKEPHVQVKLGAIILRGVITDLNFSWSGVFRNGVWTKLEVSMSLKEAREIPLGSKEVRAGAWKNG